MQLELLKLLTNQVFLLNNKVNQFCQSVSIPSIFAAGDCTPGPMVAHKSTMEAEVVVDYLYGGGRSGLVEYGSLPSVIYTQPELSWTGKYML